MWRERQVELAHHLVAVAAATDEVLVELCCRHEISVYIGPAERDATDRARGLCVPAFVSSSAGLSKDGVYLYTSSDFVRARCLARSDKFAGRRSRLRCVGVSQLGVLGVESR